MRCVDVLVEQTYIDPFEKIKFNIEKVKHKNNNNYIDFEKRLFDYEASIIQMMMMLYMLC